MNGFEALNILYERYLQPEYYGSKSMLDIDKYKRTIETKLKRLEAIDNVKPSEALEGLKHIKKYYVPEPCSTTTYDYLEIIEQALIKAQEQEKVLNIIKKKNVDIYWIQHCKNETEYNERIKFYRGVWKIPKTEFDLLKEMLENELF